MSYVNQLTLLDGSVVDIEAKSYDGNPIPVSKGGTGASSAQSAREMLGLGSASTLSSSNLLVDDEMLPTGSAIMDYVGYYLDMRLKGWTHNQTNFVYGKDSVFLGFNDGNIEQRFESSIAQSTVILSNRYRSISFDCGSDDDCVAWEIGTDNVSDFTGHKVRFMIDDVDTASDGGAKISFIVETTSGNESVVKTFIGSKGTSSDYVNTDTSIVLGNNVCIDYEFPESFYNFYIVFGHINDDSLSETDFDTLKVVNFKAFDVTDEVIPVEPF